MLPECLGDLPWREQAKTYCEQALNIGEFVSVAVCKQQCMERPDCQAFHHYPPEQAGRDDLYFGSTCFLSLGPCSQFPSNYGATVYIKPGVQDLPRHCLCPSEVFDGELVNHTLFSSAVARFSRYLPAWDIAEGEAMVSDGLFVKFNAGSKIQISFRLLGTSINKLAPPLLLLHPPPTLSHTPSEAAVPSPQSMCVCASRAGLDMIDLPMPSPASTSAPPANFSLQALIELKALSCFCTPPLRSVLSDTPAGGGVVSCALCRARTFPISCAV
jgi:hypothetical protein